MIQQPSPIRSLFSGRTGPAFAQRTWPGRPDTWLIVVAVLVNLSWRLVRYGLNFPIWGDEAMLAVNICDRDWIGLAGTLDYNQTAPLGFLWAESCMARMFGTSLYALRLLPLVCGILSTLLFVRLACAWLPRRSAALAIAVFCASYYPVRHATEIKPYAVDLFVCLCLTLLGLQLHRNRNRHRGWLAWVWGASGGWTDGAFCWRKEYDLRCGHPLAVASRTGKYTFVRNFTGCDVFVDTNCAGCAGAFQNLYGEIRLKGANEI